jgi:hypothetical protein
MIYVDDLKKCLPRDERAGGRWRWRKFCHLFSDHEADDLIAFAQKIAVKEIYIQTTPGGSWFSLTATMRSRAVREGAKQITGAQFAAMFNSGKIV